MSLLKETLRYTTIYDWILFVVLLSLSFSGLLLARTVSPSTNTVVIEVERKTLYRLLLEEDRIVDLQGPMGITRVEIKNRMVRVVESPCPNKLCIRQGWTSHGTIICLPNRVVVTIGEDTRKDIDAITG